MWNREKYQYKGAVGIKRSSPVGYQAHFLDSERAIA
jgi:hypothetical protein